MKRKMLCKLMNLWPQWHKITPIHKKVQALLVNLQHRNSDDLSYFSLVTRKWLYIRPTLGKQSFACQLPLTDCTQPFEKLFRKKWPVSHTWSKWPATACKQKGKDYSIFLYTRTVTLWYYCLIFRSDPFWNDHMHQSCVQQKALKRSPEKISKR